MALLQIIQTSHGVPALYWKLASATFNSNGSCTITLNGYYDENARRDNKEKMKEISYTISVDEMTTVFPTGFNMIDAYNYIKTQTEFLFGAESLV